MWHSPSIRAHASGSYSPSTINYKKNVVTINAATYHRLEEVREVVAGNRLRPPSLLLLVFVHRLVLLSLATHGHKRRHSHLHHVPAAVTNYPQTQQHSSEHNNDRKTPYGKREWRMSPRHGDGQTRHFQPWLLRQ
ncbi:hypothetical protein, unlikely [Trypanosoma brucei gambiense DAL972]|uniref:Uncharacterized protein n=1 Tax=Trypanosoma brucei gambiense (strain MHOM/CI/86/DAL972) TaxID=679716 RepID=C9ZUS3_TRYB9|nr:hypothetical protein, unlikely [Trypanosoma brucei gambiense DAL972]CBH13161.1 hypothetical protein, unlikely [Trypanosoma brucei gambiense DAL972]|eukprot:XP_011775438.1 hypothetical protein, unlikely [Trypanosoma brucei gambiense DAL972]